MRSLDLRLFWGHAPLSPLAVTIVKWDPNARLLETFADARKAEAPSELGCACSVERYGYSYISYVVRILCVCVGVCVLSAGYGRTAWIPSISRELSIAIRNTLYLNISDLSPMLWWSVFFRSHSEKSLVMFVVHIERCCSLRKLKTWKTCSGILKNSHVKFFWQPKTYEWILLFIFKAIFYFCFYVQWVKEKINRLLIVKIVLRNADRFNDVD